MGYQPPPAPPWYVYHNAIEQTGDMGISIQGINRIISAELGKTVTAIRPPSRPSPMDGHLPATPYQRWLWDAYGPPRTDWFSWINAGLAASLVALVVAVPLYVAGLL